MDRNFARALSLVLKHEGGWADHPSDPGGATMKGVTIATFRRFVKPTGTKAELRAISDAQVATVYRRQYWDEVHGAELPDGVDFAVFDFGVNSGPSRAIKYLQAVLKVEQDGRIGPKTITAARAMPHAQIIHALCDARLAFLKRLKTWPTFGKGWASRVKDVRSQALLMASAKPSVVKASEPAAAQVDEKPSVVLVDGPKTDETTVVVVPTPKNEPATNPAPPSNKSGIAAFAAMILAAVAAAIKYFGG